MIIHDGLYGQATISELVIQELLQAPSLKRLRHISQHGYSEPYHPGTDFSRFEHSVGVMLLLRKFGASLEEQVSGLIHDVSHTTFSHCIDYTLASGDGSKQNHQDNTFIDFFYHSEIPGILKKHDFNPTRLQTDRYFPLREKLLPNLCADRLDYSLRLAQSSHLLSKLEIKEILHNLTVVKNNWVFKNITSAKKYAKLFFLLNKHYYASLDGAAMHYTVSQYLQHALTKHYITPADFYTTDQKILKKIKTYHQIDADLRKLFDRMNNKYRFTNNPQHYDAKLSLKSRLVDPLFMDKSTIIRLSKKWPNWQKIVTQELLPKHYWLKFSNSPRS